MTYFRTLHRGVITPNLLTMKLIEKPIRQIPKDLNQISDRIEYVRCVLGYPVGAFASKIGSGRETVQRIIKGESTPNIGLIDNLLKIFPINTSWLYMNKGKPFTIEDIEPFKYGFQDKGNADLELIERMKELRKKLDLTQAVFAAQVGVTKDNLASIEVGRSNVSVAVLKRMIERFNVSERWLLWGEGKMFKT